MRIREVYHGQAPVLLLEGVGDARRAATVLLDAIPLTGRLHVGVRDAEATKRNPTMGRASRLKAERRALQEGDEVAVMDLVAQTPEPRRPTRVRIFGWNPATGW